MGCVKAIDTEAIACRLADWLGELPTPVLSLQNGVDNEAVLTRHLGTERVLGGLAVRIGSHYAPPAIRAQPIRPIRSMSLSAEMSEDYWIFKAAGLLHEWRKKWAAYLPEPD